MLPLPCRKPCTRAPMLRLFLFQACSRPYIVAVVSQSRCLPVAHSRAMTRNQSIMPTIGSSTFAVLTHHEGGLRQPLRHINAIAGVSLTACPPTTLAMVQVCGIYRCWQQGGLSG